MKKAILLVSAVLLSVSGIINGACPSSDLNGDCKVNLADFAIFTVAWLTSPRDSGWDVASDLIEDNSIDNSVSKYFLGLIYYLDGDLEAAKEYLRASDAIDAARFADDVVAAAEGLS